MSLEDTTNELANIRHKIAELKQFEEVYMLVKFYHDAQKMLVRKDEIQINMIFHSTSILERFITEYDYFIDGIKYRGEDKLFRQLRSSHTNFRTEEYLKEYKVIAETIVSQMEKKERGQQFFIINKEMTPENFLQQINPEYAIKYLHYGLDKSLPINDEQKKTKYKI